MNENDVKNVTARLAGVGVLGNVFLAVFKFVAGIWGHSAAMVSDSIHTLSDVFATLIAFIGVSMSRKEADREHPYGHDRLECVASIILSTVLFMTGAGIGWSCIRRIVVRNYGPSDAPGILPVIAAIVSILVKEAMFWYTMYYAKKLKSGAFKADAWHHRSDALSSIGALLGIVGARYGYPVLDPVAGLIICIMIMAVAVGIFKDAADKLLDTSCDPVFEDSIRGYVESFARTENQKTGLDLLRSRKFGEKIYLELEISLDGSMPLSKAHGYAERLHNLIEGAFPDVKHVMIHVNPTEPNSNSNDLESSGDEKDDKRIEGKDT